MRTHRIQNAGMYGPTMSGMSQVATSRLITIETPAARNPPATSATASVGPTAKNVPHARPRNQPLSSTSPLSTNVRDAPARAATMRASTLVTSADTARWGAAIASTTTLTRPTQRL